MRFLLLVVFLGYYSICVAQKNAKPIEKVSLEKEKHNKKKDIISVLTLQQKEWNEGNLEAFMSHYWNSDTLRFVSKNGVVYGFDKVFDRYKKSYPDKASMGNLEFEIINVDLISDLNAMVTGKWLLKVENKFKGGYFTLMLRKIKEKWTIIADHTS